MPLPIEDYALIGDGQTAALVGLNGSIDWLCLPRFDSPACFCALLATSEQGRWQIAPNDPVTSTKRKYQDGTLILVTEFTTAGGTVRVTDFMPSSDGRQDIVRIVQGLRGELSIHMELVIRFDYGSVVPWVRQVDGKLLATTGPDTLELSTDVSLYGEDMKSLADFTVHEGDCIPFVLNYRPSYADPAPALDALQALSATQERWRKWTARCTYLGRWHDEVVRSLITLKALIYVPTGGIVAAPTTSLPERWGGVRNWDYRYCWLRDSTFTLNAMLLAGYHDEAISWRDWLQRAAGGPEDLKILYSVTGERRLDEYEVKWLPGYMGAAPVRVGNAASRQFQLDVYGEVMDTLHLSRTAGLKPEPEVWRIQMALLDFLETHWREPDEGIWEVRGPRRHFTHSKMMAWVAFDRAIKDVEEFGYEGPVERWRALRDEIHAQVCNAGYNAQENTFVQAYDSDHLDASLLLMPQLGFLPPDDTRVLGTIAAIERNLVVQGLVLRYSRTAHVDTLPPGESTFLPCSFWFVDSLVLTGRRDEGQALFERLIALTNDVGLLSEEYDPNAQRMLGNFPQALTHMALINSACLLSISDKQAQRAWEKSERPTALSQTS